MNLHRRLKPLLVGLLGIAVLVLVLPGLVYIASLVMLPKLPSPPVSAHMNERASHAWAFSGGAGLYLGHATDAPMAMVQLNPWSVTWHFLIRCKHNTNNSGDFHACIYYFPGYMAASSAAELHLHKLGYVDPPSFLQALSQVALAIWITRHWSPEQVATYLAGTASPSV